MIVRSSSPSSSIGKPTYFLGSRIVVATGSARVSPHGTCTNQPLLATYTA